MAELTSGIIVQRRYLFVPPEEYLEAQAQGARWDAEAKRWYIGADEPLELFALWLSDTPMDEGFSIASTDGYVAAATTSCRRCRSRIEVICLYCESGTVSGDPLTRFTVCGIWAMDEGLAGQLKPWPTFREAGGPEQEGSYFANHCSHCGALQEDMYLHSEPEDPFFDIPRAAPGSITLTPLAGTIRLSGSEHFVVA
jgi:Domain of unknown function (DUF5710)